MKTTVVLLLILFFAGCIGKKQESNESKAGIKTSITKSQLEDKIKGGWAGQVIGCTFGGPTEFRFKGTMINDYQPIPWNENSCKWYYENSPGLYDDVYMDLTFVDVFEKEGLDAPASAHAHAYANAEYMLWHANQAGRYNILNGIMPPQSGHWLNNPHADDIDFQIEADFAGLMSPGMVNTSSEICDNIGHIMNYGDGWYGGVYVAAMYSLAFVSDDVEFIVSEALKSIPSESQFYKCIADVIKWHKQYPADWQQNWFEVQRKWSSEVGCPDGVFVDFNIDAKINAAYIVIGLLYGDGDYSKTLEISTRCGQDSDCNPASAGGILGTVLGYSRIPDFWKNPVLKVEDMDFKYTTMSLNDVYSYGTKHALALLVKNGAKIEGDAITLPVQEIKPVRLEVAFEGHFPVERRHISEDITAGKPELEFEFNGNGFVLTGATQKTSGTVSVDVDLELEISIDGGLPETFSMPTEFARRRHEIAWKYKLAEGNHKVKITWENPNAGFKIRANDLIVYSGNQIENAWKK